MLLLTAMAPRATHVDLSAPGQSSVSSTASPNAVPSDPSAFRRTTAASVVGDVLRPPTRNVPGKPATDTAASVVPTARGTEATPFSPNAGVIKAPAGVLPTTTALGPLPVSIVAPR